MRFRLMCSLAFFGNAAALAMTGHEMWWTCWLLGVVWMVAAIRYPR